MSMRSQLLKLTVSLLVTVSFCAPSVAKEANYARWVDSDGVTHYGKRAPVGVEAVTIKTKEKGSDEGKAVGNHAEDPDDSAQPDLTERTEALLAQRKQQCKEERERLVTLKTPNSLIGVKMDDGTTKYLTPEEVAKDIDSTEKFIERACQDQVSKSD